MIHALLDTLPVIQAAVWEDEAGIDLNPRIGFDRMLSGTQRHVRTPGKNVKRGTWLARRMPKATVWCGSKASGRPAACSSTC